MYGAGLALSKFLLLFPENLKHIMYVQLCQLQMQVPVNGPC